MNLFIRLIFVSFFTLLGAFGMNYVVIKYPTIKVIAPVIVAVCAISSTFFSNIILERFSDPKPIVSISIKESEIELSIRTKKMIDVFAIQIPVLGSIIDVINNNYITDVELTRKMVWGPNTKNSANRLELLLSKIIPNKEINLKIPFNPLDKSFSLGGFDVYKYSYYWNYNGNQKIKSVEKNIYSNETVDHKAIETYHFEYLDRVLSEKEIIEYSKKSSKKEIK